MADTPAGYVIPELFPETIGVSSMMIWVPEDFRGDAAILWWYPGKPAVTDMQRMTCSTSWLLQGIFHNVQGSRFLLDRVITPACFEARVVALVVHQFYRTRITTSVKAEVDAFVTGVVRAAGLQSIAEGRLPSLLPSGDKKHGEEDEP